ncbi:hypothetical protein BDW22DRAFT_883319 [Trametopsis cervina]|nr:hypothetical protein BDW22DRAFT_883319 [Trametopsis cervina]
MDSRGLEDHTRQKVCHLICKFLRFLRHSQTSTALVVAIHEPSGQLVCIKGVQSSLQEHCILQQFADHPGHSQNHCVPLLDVFQDPDDPEVTYMVMPYLHPINKPPFVTVGEVMDFVGQMLEGLDFLHTHGVAHRNGDISNVMMDANALLRRYHAMNADSNPTADHPAQMLPRHRTGVRYYFGDSDLAMRVEHPQSVNKYVVGPCGKNRMVPEFSSSGPYDVFKADVYILGGMAMSSHRYDDQS